MCMCVCICACRRVGMRARVDVCVHGHASVVQDKKTTAGAAHHGADFTTNELIEQKGDGKCDRKDEHHKHPHQRHRERANEQSVPRAVCSSHRQRDADAVNRTRAVCCQHDVRGGAACVLCGQQGVTAQLSHAWRLPVMPCSHGAPSHGRAHRLAG